MNATQTKILRGQSAGKRESLARMRQNRKDMKAKFEHDLATYQSSIDALKIEIANLEEGLIDG